MSEREPDPRRAWMLDERSHAGRENLDPAHVARYDSKEDADATAEVARLEPFGLDEQANVVDLGAGTGQFSMAAAAVVAKVVAVDVSPVMLDHLQAKIDRARLANVALVRAGFLSYEHGARPADIVYSRFALHHLPDFWKAVALRRVHRMLRPGGVLRLWDVVYRFGPVEAEERIEAWCATGGTEAEAEWARSEIEEHVRDEHSTFTWLLEPMIERCGFAIEEASYADDGIFARYLARRE